MRIAFYYRDVYKRQLTGVLPGSIAFNSGSVLYLLRGKVICGCCKHALHLANGTSYRCRFSSTIPSLDCYNIHIREKELNQLVYELLCKQFQVAFGIDSLAALRKVDTVAIRQADFDRQIFELQEDCLLYTSSGLWREVYCHQ